MMLMAKIVIYDATELDEEQIRSGLEDTDHECVFVESNIDDSNVDPEAEVIAIFVTSTVTREMINAMPRLKLIACRSTGFNNVDLGEAERKGVAVVNVPTYGESTVAEYAFTLLLALTRRLSKTFNADSETEQDELMGSDLHGKTFGIIGTGHIGKKSIGIAKGFGMEVVAYDPFPDEDAARELGYSYRSLDEVVATADALSLHAPYTEQTKHIINADVLAKMKSTAFLVNTARGELIDTHALAVALGKGEIAGAALDVFEGEGLLLHDEELALLRADHVSSEALMHSAEILSLSKMPHVIITPHNAFNTIEALQRINGTTAENIIQFWHGKTPNQVQAPAKTMGKLILVRHTESEWNASGQWTGSRDVHLSENGFREAAMLGHALEKMSIKFDVAFCSEQIRTLETLEAILNSTRQLDVPIIRSGALNERDYGDYTGMNKWEVKEKVGEEEWNEIRRGWDVDIPNGESLKQVYERARPYYLEEIMKLLKQGKNVLLVAHGNSLRALIKYIDSIPDEGMEDLEMLFGDIVQYQVDEDGLAIDKDVSHVNFKPMHEKYHANAKELAQNIHT